MRKKTVDNHKVKFMHMEVWKAAGFPSISPVTLPLSPSLSHAKSRSWRALTQAPITHRYTHTHCSHHIWFFPVSEWHKKRTWTAPKARGGSAKAAAGLLRPTDWPLWSFSGTLIVVQLPSIPLMTTDSLFHLRRQTTTWLSGLFTHTQMNESSQSLTQLQSDSSSQLRAKSQVYQTAKINTYLHDIIEK